MSKEIEDILVKLCMQQPSNAVFEEPLTEAMLSIKKIVEGFAFEHECEQGKKYIILLDDHRQAI